MATELDERISRQLRLLTLSPLRHTSNREHLYADFAELLALFSGQNLLTDVDLVRHYRAHEIHATEETERETERLDARSTEELDAEEQWAKDVFRSVRDRSSLFEQDYPFQVTDTTIVLTSETTERQLLYLVLLVCSNLNYVQLMQDKLTSDFEHISCEALKELLPQRAVIKNFGKNCDYSGNARQKIRALAADMSLSVDEAEVATIQGNQERGLDVVAWLPFRDRLPNMISILGQCACGKKWSGKQHETRRFDSSYFRFYKRPPIHALFVPYCLKRNEDAFYESDEVQTGTLLLDRGRLLELICDAGFFGSLESHQFVQRCLEHEGIALG